MAEVLLVPLKMLLKILKCLFVVGVSWCGCDDVSSLDVAVQLLLKMRLKVLRLVARLGWSMLLRFLHEMLLVRLKCDVSMVQLNPYG